LSLESRKNTAMQDPGAEMVDKMTSLWDRYGRMVLVALGAVAAIVAVTFFILRYNAQQNNAAAKDLVEADYSFRRGDLENAKTTALKVAKTYGSTPSGIDAHRIAGDASFWSGNFKDAVTEYKAYLAKSSTGLPAQCVRRSLAYALDNEKQFAEAAKTYDLLPGAFDRESSAEMLSSAARCYLATGNKAEAVKRLQRISDEFGETSYAERARVRLAELAPATN
jgi:tetratricopeptide (TPR) repeat protein